tara:strand:- start:6152 stop:7198 length:1047 start_codon:yes stop_codon:yes gene_type:complete
MPTTPCPRCGQAGAKVGLVTLESLLNPEAKARLKPADWQLCTETDCEVIYFAESLPPFEKPDLTVRAGFKETEAPRPVCYCFDHSIEEIEDEVTRTGTSTVFDDIRARMKDGCWCETKSPRGACCLGAVNRAIRAAQGRNAHGGEEPTGDCCAKTGPNLENSRNGALASAGAVFAAVASSACCWAPLLLVGFGMSGAALGSILEVWRPWFLGAAALLLGLAFWMVYRRRTAAWRRAFVWISAFAAAGFAAFPAIPGFSPQAADSVPPAGEGIEFAVEGMTCPGCASALAKDLRTVPGVNWAGVNFEAKTATVVLTAPDAVSESRNGIQAAIEPGGFFISNSNPKPENQ